MENKNNKLILEGVLTKFSPRSYPGRIYGMYIWNWDKNKWGIDRKFCEDNGIPIKK